MWGRSYVPAIIPLLLQAGADPSIKNDEGETPWSLLQEKYPSHPTALALVEEMRNAEKASFLVKVRRFVLATRETNRLRSWEQRRMPRVALAPLAAGQNDDEETGKVRARLEVLLGMVTTGHDGKLFPGDLFRAVLDFVMPTWDPLRRAGGAGGQQQQQQEQEHEQEQQQSSEKQMRGK